MKIKSLVLHFPKKFSIYYLGEIRDGKEVTEIRADRARAGNVVFKIVSNSKILREIVTPSYEIHYEHLEVLE